MQFVGCEQDHPKAIETLKGLDVPYICAVPLVFQSFEEWQNSELGLHPIQVLLAPSIPRFLFSSHLISPSKHFLLLD